MSDNRPPPGQTWIEYLQQVTSGLTRQQISRITGINVSGVSRWLGGQNRPNADKVIALARGLGRPPIEALIAAGYLEPEDAEGVIEVKRSRRELSDAELLVELQDRLAR